MVLIVNLIGLGLIGLIVVWFLVLQPKPKKVANQITDVLVQDGVYQPAVIQAHPQQQLKLRFTRKDSSPCSEVVVFDGDHSYHLPLNQPEIIAVTAPKTGVLEFACQMGMYRGKIVVAA